MHMHVFAPPLSDQLPEEIHQKTGNSMWSMNYLSDLATNYMRCRGIPAHADVAAHQCARNAA